MGNCFLSKVHCILINYGDEAASTKDDSSGDSAYTMTPHVNVSPSPRSDDRQQTQILGDLIIDGS